MEDISGLLNGESATAATEETPEAEETQPEESAEQPAASIPEGVEVVKMPRLSDTMGEGTVASWLKGVGDTVEEGEILAEIETDKATMEFESFYAGELLHIRVKVGESAAVDSLLAIIGPSGTDVAAVLAAASSADTPKTEEPKTTTVDAPPPTTTTKPSEPVETTVVEASANSNQRIMASPLAKKMAAEKGIDLRQVQGSGEHGRIVKRDIEQFVPSTTTRATPFAPKGQESSEDIPNSQMRR